MLKHQRFNTFLLTVSLLFLMSLLMVDMPFQANHQFINFASVTNTNGQSVTQSYIITTYVTYLLLWLSTTASLVLTFFRQRFKKTWRILIIIETFFAMTEAQYVLPVIGLCFYLFEMFYDHKQWNFMDKINWQKFKVPTKIIPDLCFLVVATFTTIAIFRQMTHYVYSTPWLKPAMYFNIFILLCLYWLLRVTTNNYWIALFTSTFLTILLFQADQIKMIVRNDAVIPSDLTMLKGTNDLLEMIDPLFIVWFGLILLILICLTIFLTKHYPITKLHLKTRLSFGLVSCLFFASTLFWNHNNVFIQNLMTNTVYEQYPRRRLFQNQALGVKRNGPLLQFLNNVDIQIMNEPKGYSKKVMQQLAKKYQDEANITNQQRHHEISDYTIIFNLSESFADPKRVPSVQYKGEAIPYIKQLKKETTSGIMMSSGYGAGTANMEYMSLTGLATANFSPTLNVPYTQIIPFQKHTYNFADLFKSATTVHPYNNSFYDRSIDYPKMNIKKFYYLHSPNHPIKHIKMIGNSGYVSDDSFYQNILDQINRQKHGQFINAISMQNHYPYDNNYPQSQQHWQATAGYGIDLNQLNNYIEGIHLTDQAVKSFKQKLDHNKKPIVWVFYGDHLPGIYNNNMSKDGLQLHQTDYFIYLNPAAKKLAKQNQTNSNLNQYVDPNDFAPMTMQLTNSKLTPYLQLSTDLYQKLPTKVTNVYDDGTFEYNTSAQFINHKTGKIIPTNKLTKKQRQLYHDYLLIQYDQTTGKHYLKANFFK